MLKIKNASKFKCNLYTWIRIHQLKLMRIHVDPDLKLCKKQAKVTFQYKWIFHF